MSNRFSLLTLFIIFSFCCKQQKDLGENTKKEKIVCLDTVLDYSAYDPTLNNHNLSKGDTFKILDSLNINSGTWLVVVDYTNFKDYKNDSLIEKEFGFPTGGYYLLDDTNVLREMKNEWIVKYNNEDCCTPSINMNFFKDAKLVLSLGIVHNIKRAGFQTSEYGWTPIGNENIIKKYYKHFKYCDSL